MSRSILTKTRCGTCDTPLDEIPFDKCEEHERFFALQPDVSEEEFQEQLDAEFLRLSMTRSGDD